MTSKISLKAQTQNKHKQTAKGTLWEVLKKQHAANKTDVSLITKKVIGVKAMET